MVKAKIGTGVAVYQFDNREYAMEIIEQLLKNGDEFTANFDWHTANSENV